jgi:hypothetical protein
MPERPGCWINGSAAPMAHLVEKDTLLRANAAMILLLVGGGLVACALGSVIVDVGRMFGAW